MSHQDEYREGFVEGYRCVMGNMAMLPMLPMMPMVPMGQTAYRVGLRVGLEAAGVKVPD